MTRIRAILCTTILTVMLVFFVHHAAAQVLNVTGTLSDTEDKAIRNGNVMVTYGNTTLKAVSNKDGKFRFQVMDPGPVNITFEAPGYSTVEEQGVQLAHGMDLSMTLRKEGAGGWWVSLLLIPGVLGLFVAAAKEWGWGQHKEARPNKEEAGQKKEVQGSLATKEGGGESGSGDELEKNRFWVAFVSGLIWFSTLVLMAWAGGLGSQGVYKVQFFHPKLAFDFYVPIFGFVGALLYVLDLFRRPLKDFPKGTEFGMRLIMGPYVAIVIVVLFGADLGLVDLTSPIGQGTLAFFSGLLVVVALQGLTERGNEWLGQWRQRTRYEPSEVAKEFELTQEEDLTLRKAGIRHLVQLRERKEDDLRKEVRRVGFDENLAADFRRQLKKKQVREAIGDLAWERLKAKNAKTVEEFVHLDDSALQEISGQDPKLDVEHLIALRDQARDLVKPQ